jgi:hypothetical protein
MQSTKTRVLVENHDKAHRRRAWSATSAALAQGPINDTASPTLTCGSAREMSAIVVKRRACVTCHCFFQVYRTVILNRVLEWDHKSGSINRILIFGEYSTNFWTRVRFDSNSDLGEFEFQFQNSSSNLANHTLCFKIQIRRISANTNSNSNWANFAPPLVRTWSVTPGRPLAINYY